MNVLAGEDRPEVLKAEIAAQIEKTPGAVLDYVAIVDWNTLKPVEKCQGRLLVALAVRFGTTRLIDNLIVQVPTTVA